MSIWFTSDTHIGHKNVIKYCNRPFSSVEEMDEAIVQRWNERVKKGDVVYHLGDFAFIDSSLWRSIVSRLNGQIHLIRGNHDKDISKDLFASVSDIKQIRVKDEDCQNKWQYIILCHYAMRVWDKSHFGSWHLYGHSHGTLPDDINSLSMDVGVDTNNFYPYSYEEIKEKMKVKQFVPVDHHDRSRK